MNFGKLALIFAVVLGVAGGLGLFTFHYAAGTSYFSADPRACVNCHIMLPQYDSWSNSSHHGVATCIECHLPHSLIPKLIAKAENGFWHSKGFTLQDFHEPIQITPRNSKILQDNCLRCHEAMTHNIVDADASDAVRCVHCHSDVGHGLRN